MNKLICFLSSFGFSLAHKRQNYLLLCLQRSIVFSILKVLLLGKKLNPTKYLKTHVPFYYKTSKCRFTFACLYLFYKKYQRRYIVRTSVQFIYSKKTLLKSSVMFCPLDYEMYYVSMKESPGRVPVYKMYYVLRKESPDRAPVLKCILCQRKKAPTGLRYMKCIMCQWKNF